MSSLTLPNSLWRAASEVKRFLEKMPDGATLDRIDRSVGSYHSLRTGEREKLIDFLISRESILTFRATKTGSRRPATFLRHKKFGHPKSVDGYKIFQSKTKICSKCKEEKKYSQFYKNATKSDGLQAYCIECDKENSPLRDWRSGENYAKKLNPSVKDYHENTKEPDMTNTQQASQQKTASELRKQAEELLKAAEEAERQSIDKDRFNKLIGPLRLEAAQAATKLQRKLDEIIDDMDSMMKVVEKLKSIEI